MRIIVQKFGGSSVATPELRQEAAERVTWAVREGFRPAVVVSAMGRVGDPYATDTLLSLPGGPLPPRESDLLLACGELLSAAVMAATLRQQGLPARSLSGWQAGIVTDETFGDATILRVEPVAVIRCLEAGLVPVVAGFQGATEQGEITTLGRGGSDTTAAALGGALRAEVVEIYTDVDGVMTADPRIVPEARTLSVSTYDEVAQLAILGARVIHPRAVQIAMQRSVPLRIKATRGQGAGTLITYSHDAALQDWGAGRPQQAVTGITQIPRLCQVQVGLAPEDPRGVALFRALAEAGISVDLINVSPGQKCFCIDETAAGRAGTVLREMGLEPELRPGCAKVSVVGAGMRGRPGVMATVVEALARAGVPVLQSADSHVTISCLVPAAQMEAAVRALHQGFGLG